MPRVRSRPRATANLHGRKHPQMDLPALPRDIAALGSVDRLRRECLMLLRQRRAYQAEPLLEQAEGFAANAIPDPSNDTEPNVMEGVTC